MKIKKKILSLILVSALAITSLVGCSSSNTASSSQASSQQQQPSENQDAETVKFTDSAGREVEIPKNIERIAPTGALAQIVLFSVSPDKMVGISTEWSDDAKEILTDKYANLPVFGQMYGTSDLNTEALAAADPQVIIDIGELKEGAKEDLDSMQEQLGIPVIFVEATLESMPDCYTTLGKILGEEEKAQSLSDYCKNTYDTTVETMKKIDDDDKVDVLYCAGDTGTSVIGKGSFHAEIIDLLANNVAELDNPSSKGTGDEVSLEQIYMWDPDVIIFAPQSIYSTVGEDKDWQKVEAIKDGDYYESPDVPYNWMGMPPSVNRYMGMIWLSETLYPDEFDYDLKEKTKEYYKLFYNADLTDEQYENITKNAIK